MDELKLLAEMRAEITGRAPEEMHEARARMLAPGRETLPRRLAAALGFTSGAPRRVRRAVVPAGAAAVVAAAAAIAVAISGGQPPEMAGPGRGPGPGNRVDAGLAAYVLNRAAAAARATPAPVPEPSQYIYLDVKELAWSGGQVTASRPSPFAYLRQDERHYWMSADGKRPGVLDIIPAGPGLAIPGEPYPPASIRRQDGPTGWMPLGTNTCPSINQPTYEYLTTLPANPDALLKYLYAHAGRDEDLADSAWDTIYQLHTDMLVPPRLRAAFFQAAARIPGVTVADHAVDAAGRPGIAVAKVISGKGTSDELIFDPRTYQFLGTESVTVSPHSPLGPAGTTVGSSAVLRVAVADHPPAAHSAMKLGSTPCND